MSLLLNVWIQLLRILFLLVWSTVFYFQFVYLVFLVSIFNNILMILQFIINILGPRHCSFQCWISKSPHKPHSDSAHISPLDPGRQRQVSLCGQVSRPGFRCTYCVLLLLLQPPVIAIRRHHHLVVAAIAIVVELHPCCCHCHHCHAGWSKAMTAMTTTSCRNKGNCWDGAVGRSSKKIEHFLTYLVVVVAVAVVAVRPHYHHHHHRLAVCSKTMMVMKTMYCRHRRRYRAASCLCCYFRFRRADADRVPWFARRGLPVQYWL